MEPLKIYLYDPSSTKNFILVTISLAYCTSSINIIVSFLIRGVLE